MDIKLRLGQAIASKLNDWLKSAGSNASVGSFEEAAKFGDVVVLAVKGTAALNVLEKAGSKNLANKTILDTTNPIADAPPVNGVLQYFTNQNDSLMEQLQSKFPESNFVKVFSCVGIAIYG